MIIVGYQGIGKSTLAGRGSNYIDLESGNFWVNGNRSDDWYIPYCQIANHLSQQGFDVFVSSHEVVRKELEKSEEQVYVLFPSLDLKDKWIGKLRYRYEHTGLEKDFKALANAEDRYDENIKELMSCNLNRCEIKNIGYDLRTIIQNLNDGKIDIYKIKYTSKED